VSSLNFKSWIAWIAAAVVELLGFSAISTAMEFSEHNRTIAEDEPRKAPEKAARWMVVVYFIAVILITVFLEPPNEFQDWALLIFPALSATGVFVLSMRKVHRERVDEMILSGISPYSRKKYLPRKQQLLAEIKSGDEEKPKPDKKEESKVDLDKMSKQEAIVYLASKHPKWTQAKIALEVGCSESHVSRTLSRMEEEGEA
jgi:hypothetical protein